MKIYKYDIPAFSGRKFSDNITKTYTRDEILKEYFMDWSQRMREANKEDEISEENCIEDWIGINWAWEEKLTNNSSEEYKDPQTLILHCFRKGE